MLDRTNNAQKTKRIRKRKCNIMGIRQLDNIGLEKNMLLRYLLKTSINNDLRLCNPSLQYYNWHDI